MTDCKGLRIDVKQSAYKNDFPNAGEIGNNQIIKICCLFFGANSAKIGTKVGRRQNPANLYSKIFNFELN